MGSLRRAYRDALTAMPQGYEAEFWGASGPFFRSIDWQNGAIRAKDDALDMAWTINGNGREALMPDNFDTVILYGARYRFAKFFCPLPSLD